MRVIEKTIYQFDELTDAAKEKARGWFRGIACSDNWWAECVIDDAKHIGAMIGFDVDKIYWRGFSSQGDGACWTGSATYSTGCAAAVARECPQDSEIQRIARAWEGLQCRNFYQIRGSVSANDRYMRTRVDAYRADDCDVIDEDDAGQTVSDFADWIYRSLEREYDYRMSDECVDEDIRANEYEFGEDGGRA